MDGQLNLVDVACRKRGAACTGGFLSDFERVDPNSRNLLARATDRLILGGGGSPLPLPSSVQLLPAARVRGWPQADRPKCARPPWWKKKKEMGGHGFTCRMDTVGMRMKCKQKGGKRGGGGGGDSVLCSYVGDF